ncbi:hypothetical protein S40285_10249 [Stachybotrys chlorohalonatus IBT 40285]|uniref:Uncharacterized protein n=1 Tax=Stachybotrys chlorohalonatus (strain IBT 40285) TaxID=1283841 RepID=A0A084QP28_STAC4|nr:hypothetical protein S40285_10249 [Stachybotrys chlorohalonata IBT 40285]
MANVVFDLARIRSGFNVAHRNRNKGSYEMGSSREAESRWSAKRDGRSVIKVVVDAFETSGPQWTAMCDDYQAAQIGAPAVGLRIDRPSKNGSCPSAQSMAATARPTHVTDPLA